MHYKECYNEIKFVSIPILLCLFLYSCLPSNTGFDARNRQKPKKPCWPQNHDRTFFLEIC